MTLVARRRARRRAAWALALALAPLAARGEWWTVENSIETRFESNDNVYLTARTSPHVNTLSVSDTFEAARRTENSATRATLAGTALRSIGGGGIERVDGRLGLTQTLSDPLNVFRASAVYAQDFNDSAQSADVTLGRGRRRTTTVDASWSRNLTERLRADTQLAFVRTGYGRGLVGGVDYDDASASAGIDYRLSEIDSINVRGGHSRYRTRNDERSSATDDISVGASRALSDRGSIALSVGAYRTRFRSDRSGIACPLDASFCDAGLVRPVPFSVVQQSASQGLQFSASYRYRFDERTDLSFSAGRRQAPSGGGSVVTNSTLNASVERSFSETLRGTLSYAGSQSRFDAGGAGRYGQQVLALVVARQLAPDASVVATYQRTRAELLGTGASASSNSVSVSLKYEWPRFDASR